MKNSYLPHIDILRALAVLLVMFNHLDFFPFKGGFIGVDIFLVISGFLITRGIISELLLAKHFSFKNFYQRRINRLAPAFFTVIFISLCAFFPVLTSQEWKELLRTAVASVTFTSNIYYYSLLNDYFSISARSTPLLHIWSLSLEEQFYLIWPFSLLVLLKLKHKAIIGSLVIISLVSLLVSHFLALRDPLAAYYLLPSRIFEFCIGGLVAMMPARNFPPFISRVVFLITLSLIIISGMWIDHLTLFPSYIALIPCLSAALFIYAAGNNLLLVYRPILYLGKISYPMYLWHWPLIVYLFLLSIPLSTSTSLAVIFLTILLSALTFETIEKRNKFYFSEHKKSVKALLLLPTLIVLLTFSINNFLEIRQTLRPRMQTSSSTIKDLNQIRCIDQNSHPLVECYLGVDTKHEIDFLLVGDSHANAQRGFVDYLAKQSNLRGYEITYSSTAYLPGFDRSVLDERKGEVHRILSFREINIRTQNFIEKHKPHYVIMGGYFPHNWSRSIYTQAGNEAANGQDSKHNFILGLEQAIATIHQSGAVPILINDNPILTGIDVNCNLRKISRTDCSFNKVEYNKDFAEWLLLMRELQQRHPELIVVDLNHIICDSKKCYSSLNGTPLYRDNQHLTYSGSREIAIEYLKKYGNPLK